MRSFKDNDSFGKGFSQRKDLLKRPASVKTELNTDNTEAMPHIQAAASFDISVPSSSLHEIVTLDDFKSALNQFSTSIRADWLSRRPQ